MTWSDSLLSHLALARGDIDRAAHLRENAGWIDAAWNDPASRVVAVDSGRAQVEPGPAIAWRPTVGFDAPGDRYFLGLANDVAHFAVSPVPDSATGESWVSLRDVGAQLGDEDAGLFVTAVALANWHASHSRCPRCGGATEVVQAGWVRRCPNDQSLHFPRTDPAVIALVIDQDDRGLLGRQVVWPEAFFSTLAGFVEPGESAEAAVRREVKEEAGVGVGELSYLGSQPWPFPCSIMLGYHARALPDARIDVDGTEIAEAAWFSRDGLVAACEAGQVRLPSRVSIARRLIEQWFGAELPGEWTRT